MYDLNHSLSEAYEVDDTYTARHGYKDIENRKKVGNNNINMHLFMFMIYNACQNS